MDLSEELASFAVIAPYLSILQFFEVASRNHVETRSVIAGLDLVLLSGCHRLTIHLANGVRYREDSAAEQKLSVLRGLYDQPVFSMSHSLDRWLLADERSRGGHYV